MASSTNIASREVNRATERLVPSQAITARFEYGTKLGRMVIAFKRDVTVVTKFRIFNSYWRLAGTNSKGTSCQIKS
jgi:hypothetical protein